MVSINYWESTTMFRSPIQIFRLFLGRQVPEVELVLEHDSDGGASPATALSGGATRAWPAAVQASDRPPVKHQRSEREYRRRQPGKVWNEIS